MEKKSGVDFFDLHNGQFLTVADALVIPFTAFHFERELLFAANVFDDVGHNRCASDCGRADGDVAVLVDHKHAVKGDRLASFDSQTLDFERVASDDAILFASSF